MTYETKIVGIIATNDLDILAKTSFENEYLCNDTLEDLLYALETHNVIDYESDFVNEMDAETVRRLSKQTLKNHYFIAIETPITTLSHYTKQPRSSWGYTRIIWVYTNTLNVLDEYRQQVGRLADTTLESE